MLIFSQRQPKIKAKQKPGRERDIAPTCGGEIRPVRPGSHLFIFHFGAGGYAVAAPDGRYRLNS